MSDDPDLEDGYQRITLRLPRRLHTELMQNASAKSRSMNAEIVARLEQSCDPDALSPENHAMLVQIAEVSEQNHEKVDTLARLVEGLALKLGITQDEINKDRAAHNLPPRDGWPSPK